LWCLGTQSLIREPVSISIAEEATTTEITIIQESETVKEEKYDTKENLISAIRESCPDIEKFVFCESTYRPAICSYAGCHSGMGLCGFISSTWNETLDRIKEAEDPLPDRCFQKIEFPLSGDYSEMVFDPECNIKVCQWLYEHDGDIHWYSSKACWQNW